MALPRITPRGTSLITSAPARNLVNSSEISIKPNPGTTKLLNQARPLPKRNLTWTTSGNVIIATKEATVPNRFGIYPPMKVTRSLDDYRPPRRINPLSPGVVYSRQYNGLETTEPHFKNELRRNEMKQREHFRYHRAWTTPYYGPPAEKENYRRQTREQLKLQMSDREAREREEFRDKVSESIDTVRYDMECRSRDYHDYLTKFNYLKKFRDENKQLMEWKEQQRRDERMSEQYHDREILRYNPINWSHTLK